MKSLSSLPGSAWLAGAFVLQASIASCSSVCDSIKATASIEQLRPGKLAYFQEQQNYWSTSSGSLKPDCILTPNNSDEVSAIVRALLNTTENFAIKSGGHNPNDYFASIDGGALISTMKLTEVKLDTASETVRIGPGNRWDAVAKALDGTGYSAVGGRIGNVGVGGYMLGGGLSFMSTEYGWAANSVVEYELVLANATVISVTAESNPDLFLSLKGGGNNFGIVTAFVVKAYRQGQVWGGHMIFNATDKTNEALLSAVNKFTTNYPDEKAGIILTAEFSGLGIINMWIMFVYYNGPTPPPGVFDDFLAIRPWSKNFKTQSFSKLVSGNNWAVVKGSVYTIGTETIPLNSTSPEASLEVLKSIHSHWTSISRSVQWVPGVICSIAFQPLPKSMARLARSKGGDLYDFDDDADCIVIELNFSFWGKSSFHTIDKAMQSTYGGIRDRVQDAVAKNLLPNVYLPLFANDGYFRQDIWSRLRPERKAMAAKVRKSVDPDGLWETRTGGFKIGG